MNNYNTKLQKPHKQVLARISPTETTKVDVKLKGLIELLNTFNGIETWDSCQDNDEGLAEISMSYKNDIFAFTSKLASIFADKLETSRIIVPPELLVKLSIVWDEDKKEPYIYLTFPSEDIKHITNVIYERRHLFPSRIADKQV
jgi:hypothetical protein